MKRFVCLAGVTAAILAGGCASDHDHNRGGVYDHYDKNTGYDSSGRPMKYDSEGRPMNNDDPLWQNDKLSPDDNYRNDGAGNPNNNRGTDGTYSPRP